MRAFVNLRSQYTHLKVILSVGGGLGSANFSHVASSDTTRHAFAKSVLQIVDAYGFDGVDSERSLPLRNVTLTPTS